MLGFAVNVTIMPPASHATCLVNRRRGKQERPGRIDQPVTTSLISSAKWQAAKCAAVPVPSTCSGGRTVAQIAAFSQVEQSVQINQKLDQMLQGSSLSQATSLIGKTVTSADGNTTGVVKEVKLGSSGLIAVTDGGKEIPITSGAKVS